MMRTENTEYDFKHELYGPINDPDERVNLAQDPEYIDMVAKLSSRLSEFFRIMLSSAGTCGKEAPSSPILRDPSWGWKSGETTGHRNNSVAEQKFLTGYGGIRNTLCGWAGSLNFSPSNDAQRFCRIAFVHTDLNGFADNQGTSRISRRAVNDLLD